jgi:hypothetical protein
MSDPDLDLADAALDTALAMLRWKARTLKAEAALREIEAIWFNAEGLETNDFYQIGKIARAALEGK